MSKTKITAASALAALGQVADIVTEDLAFFATTAASTADSRVYSDCVQKLFAAGGCVRAMKVDGRPVVFAKTHDGDVVCLQQAYACSRDLVTYVKRGVGFQLEQSLLCESVEHDARLINALYTLASGLPKKQDQDFSPKRLKSPTMAEMMVNSSAFTRTQKVVGYALTGVGYVGEIFVHSAIASAISAVVSPIAGGLGVFVLGALAWTYLFVEHPGFVKNVAFFGFTFSDKIMSYLWPADGEKGGVIKMGVDLVKGAGRMVGGVAKWAWRNTFGRLFGGGKTAEVAPA